MYVSCKWHLVLATTTSQLSEHAPPHARRAGCGVYHFADCGDSPVGHFAALNSKALERAGITAQTPDPQGGVIRRRAGSREPDGVLEENAYFGALQRLMPRLTVEQSVGWLEKSQALYLQFGYTTVQDGRADPGGVDTAIAAAKIGQVEVDVGSYPEILTMGEGRFMQGPYYSRNYQQHCIGGGEADAGWIATRQNRLADPAVSAAPGGPAGQLCGLWRHE